MPIMLMVSQTGGYIFPLFVLCCEVAKIVEACEQCSAKLLCQCLVICERNLCMYVLIKMKRKGANMPLGSQCPQKRVSRPL